MNEVEVMPQKRPSLRDPIPGKGRFWGTTSTKHKNKHNTHTI